MIKNIIYITIVFCPQGSGWVIGSDAKEKKHVVFFNKNFFFFLKRRPKKQVFYGFLLLFTIQFKFLTLNIELGMKRCVGELE